ncbi:MAG: hypothetical protein F4X83_02000 [Chloroflexi bacterium]|nr:hypothetical protein [Chloroflexota bacterium]
MASPLEQRQSRRVGIRKSPSKVSAALTTPRLESILSSKQGGSAEVIKWPTSAASPRRPRQRRIPKTVRSFSLRALVPGWLVKAVVMAAVIGASWLALLWVMVTQDPAQSSSRVVFVISVFSAVFVTSLPVMHRIFSRFAPSRLQQGNPVLVAGHSFLLASFLVANLSLMLVGSWNVTMFILIAAITVVVESLFLARR